MCVCKQKRKTKHHRKPQAQGGGDEDSNISFVRENKHRAWHLLFSGDMTPEDIAREINEVWLDPDFKLVVVRR